MLILPLLYLPPIPYMALLCSGRDIYIEACESYSKGSYRNRCEIVGANGPIDLSIPIAGGRDRRQLYRDTGIAADGGHWQHRHIISIMSAYGSAPFFEHYMPYLQPVLTRAHTNLFDLNKELLLLLIRLMKLDVKLQFTDQYQKNVAGAIDLRTAFRPDDLLGRLNEVQKKWHLREVPYIRVFDIKPLDSGVSSLDLLMNVGPDSGAILRQMLSEAD